MEIASPPLRDNLEKQHSPGPPPLRRAAVRHHASPPVPPFSNLRHLQPADHQPACSSPYSSLRAARGYQACKNDTVQECRRACQHCSECQARSHLHPATARWLHCCCWGTESECCSWCRDYGVFHKGKSHHLPCRPTQMSAFLLDRLSQFSKLSMFPNAAREQMKDSLQAFGPTDLHPSCQGQGRQGRPAALPPTLRFTPRTPPASQVPLAGGHAEVKALTMPACPPPKVSIAGGHAEVKDHPPCSNPYALRQGCIFYNFSGFLQIPHFHRFGICRSHFLYLFNNTYLF